MRKLTIGIVGMGALLCGASRANAQKATEFYIPVGKSPGISGVSTAIGTCHEIDVREQVVTIQGQSLTWTGTVTSRTKIWLDRSKLGLPNQKGTFADLQQGLRIEVKYEGNERTSGAACEWIKVELVRTEQS